MDSVLLCHHGRNCLRNHGFRLHGLPAGQGRRPGPADRPAQFVDWRPQGWAGLGLNCGVGRPWRSGPQPGRNCRHGRIRHHSLDGKIQARQALGRNACRRQRRHGDYLPVQRLHVRAGRVGHSGTPAECQRAGHAPAVRRPVVLPAQADRHVAADQEEWNVPAGCRPPDGRPQSLWPRLGHPPAVRRCGHPAGHNVRFSHHGTLRVDRR